MKKAEVLDNDMPTEIDFTKGERGRYAGRIAAEATVVLLEPDVIEVFPDSAAVNAALRMVIRSGVAAAGKAQKIRRAS